MRRPEMSYEPSLKRLPNFLRYVNKVYRFSDTIDSMQDRRSDTDVSAQTIFMSMFLCLLLRLGSIRQLAKDVESGRIRKFLCKVDKETYCANTLANGLENMDIPTLQRELTVVPKKLRRNKAYGSAEHPRTIGGLKIVAVDGTEHFRSECIHCPECMEVHVKTNEGVKTHYVHRIVIMYVVGRLHSSAVGVILGAEPARPKDVISGEEAGHEGESTAAKRLIEKMIDSYGSHFFDILTTDAYYTTKPFVLFVDSLGKYLVSRVKREDTTLYQEIETLSQMVDPIYVDDRENRVESWIYEIPELQTSLDWDVPTRGFKIIEKIYKIVSGEKVYIKEETFLCMATLPAELADADIVRQIVHAKWGVENNAIKDLKDNWYMEHNFHHHPNATYALLLILFMVYNLFYAYVFRHMKSYRLYQPTMKRISEDFMSSFLHWKWRMSWIWFDGKT
jgi:hypothetical protein